jgi:hypothetical protein
VPSSSVVAGVVEWIARLPERRRGFAQIRAIALVRRASTPFSSHRAYTVMRRRSAFVRDRVRCSPSDDVDPACANRAHKMPLNKAHFFSRLRDAVRPSGRSRSRGAMRGAVGAACAGDGAQKKIAQVVDTQKNRD